MATSLPARSTVSTLLDHRGYSGSDLTKLLKSARNAKGPASTAVAPPGTHIHTLSIEIEMLPPPETVLAGPYGREVHKPEPEYKIFEALRHTLTSTAEPFELVDLIKPADRAIGICPEPKSRYSFQKLGISVGVFPPSPHGKRECSDAIITMGQKRRNHGRVEANGDLVLQGADEWFLSSSAWDTENWLHAILSLDHREPAQRKGGFRDEVQRFGLQTGLQIGWEPSEDQSDPAEGATLKLVLTVNVYLDFTGLFAPAPDIATDLIGFILHSVIPSEASADEDSTSDTRNTALRHFFACMQPAPFLPRGMSSMDLQPKAMTSTLLPFQIRTLRLLLEREAAEGYARTAEADKADPRGFWTPLQADEGRMAYRRVTGGMASLPAAKPVDRKGKGRAMDVESSRDGQELSEADLKLLPSFLDLSTVRGTMLCEEMGLGKTVEAIALLLHNRHPLSTSRPALETVPEAYASVEPSRAQSVEDDDIQGADGPEQAAEVVPLVARGKPIAPARHVPKMDLLEGPPGLDDQEVKAWLKAELDAFKEARVWSEESKLEVAEVATTLIVCPPSLLKQWISEIHAHAPGLRVCVYTGWRTIMDGVRKRQAQQNKAMGAATGLAFYDRKRKASEALRKKTVKKYGGRSGTTEVKEEDDLGGDGASDGSVDPVSLLEVTQTEFEKYVRAHDVVITTYWDLSQDLAVAHPAPPRSRRNNVNYRHNERPRSPLVMVEWHRVIMDEVQLCSDQSAASEMVALIPRRNSLAVSGTPAKTDIKDLLGVLRFLRVPNLPFEPRLWHRLQQPSFRPAFEGLFRAISVRTTKRQVQDELVIPRQHLYVVPIELSQIEQHYYADTLSRVRDSYYRRGGGGLDRAVLKACLLDLRQICTHMQVGMMQGGMGPGGQAGPRANQRLNLGRELMTMGEALAKMKSDHVSEFLIEGRAQMRLMIRLGQFIVANKADNNRLIKALANYERCRDAAIKQLSAVREGIKQDLPATINIDDEDDEPTTTVAEKRAMSQQDRERAVTVSNARSAIRDLLLIQHQAWFLMGDVRHQQGEVDLETEAYGKAEDIRKEILASSLRQSVAAIARLDQLVEESKIASVEDLQTDETCGSGGIATSEPINSANELLVLMNENAMLIWEWRKRIIELLHAPVEAEELPVVPGEAAEENLEEDFYAKSLKSQGQLQVYMTAYAAALSDRKEMMSEERNLLADVDAQRTIARTTVRAKQAQEAGEEMGLYEEDDNKRLLGELMKEREAFMDARKNVCERPLKAYLIVLNSVMHNQANRKEEIAIAKAGADMIRDYVKEQTACYDSLNKELDNFRGVFNYRVKFFAALQEISDSVAEVEEPANKKTTLPENIRTCTAEISAKETRLAQLTVRGRYLDFLGDKQDKNDDELREDCIICMGSSDDTHGLLLECGHFFCASCYKAYRTSNMRGCPSCRREIDDKAITRFKLGGAKSKSDQDAMQALVAADASAAAGLDAGALGMDGEDLQRQTLREEEEQELGRTRAEEVEKAAREQDLSRISMLDLQTRREIVHMDMMGEYGSKIDFLIKHLLHYKARQPEVRHVIFSNWSDSLRIVTRALRQNGISFASFEGNQKSKDVVDNFINDPSITVFLLHAERESAGLTLTTCQVVHLLEPVLRHSFELQAIGRVDRLGQTKETTVYCYATRDTVESRILALGVRNGTSIYLKPGDVGRVEVEQKTDNVVSAAGKGGDLGGSDGNEEELLGLIM